MLPVLGKVNPATRVNLSWGTASSQDAFNGLNILFTLWTSNKYLTDTEGLHNISSCHLLYRRQVILSSSTCVKICASSTDYFITPGQQFPSVYTFRGGLKSGDGVEPNPGDAGCISQSSDGLGYTPML